mmetsp:Transcript_23552/g.66936  ORF Transcript_23552/g.66936 Transcript_23552/m.66936 type:complete len:269 (+) Transcript_23552:32-838(+)
MLERKRAVGVHANARALSVRQGLARLLEKGETIAALLGLLAVDFDQRLVPVWKVYAARELLPLGAEAEEWTLRGKKHRHGRGSVHLREEGEGLFELLGHDHALVQDRDGFEIRAEHEMAMVASAGLCRVRVRAHIDQGPDFALGHRLALDHAEREDLVGVKVGHLQRDLVNLVTEGGEAVEQQRKVDAEAGRVRGTHLPGVEHSREKVGTALRDERQVCGDEAKALGVHLTDGVLVLLAVGQAAERVVHELGTIKLGAEHRRLALARS